MGQETEIGKMVAAKLKDGTKSLSKDSWRRLNIFLEKEKQRKRKSMFHWIIGGGVGFLVLSYILFGTILLSGDSPSSQKTIPPNEKTDFTVNDDYQIHRTTVEFYDSLETNPYANKLFQPTGSSEEHMEIEKDLEPRIQAETLKKRRYEKNDESFAVTKNYHYYNSQDGKQLVTKRKAIIDSPVEKNYKRPDTLSPIKMILAACKQDYCRK